MCCFTVATGCDTPDGDYPANGPVIQISPMAVGHSAHVLLWQSTDEWELCHPALGALVLEIDCAETRKKSARIESITCQPADACSGVRFEGADGSFVPEHFHFTVTVTGDVEGVHAEKTEEVNIAPP